MVERRRLFIVGFKQCLHWRFFRRKTALSGVYIGVFFADRPVKVTKVAVKHHDITLGVIYESQHNDTWCYDAERSYAIIISKVSKRFVMCQLLAPALIGFFSFVAAINSTNEANKAGGIRR